MSAFEAVERPAGSHVELARSSSEPVHREDFPVHRLKAGAVGLRFSGFAPFAAALKTADVLRPDWRASPDLLMIVRA